MEQRLNYSEVASGVITHYSVWEKISHNTGKLQTHGGARSVSIAGKIQERNEERK